MFVAQTHVWKVLNLSKQQILEILHFDAQNGQKKQFFDNLEIIWKFFIDDDSNQAYLSPSYGLWAPSLATF